MKFRETDLKDDVLLIEQGKTGTKLRLRLKDERGIENALAKLIDRMLATKSRHKVRSPYLICNEDGQRLSYFALDSRFEKARTDAQAVVALQRNTALAAEIGKFQFRDLSAKAATDKAEDPSNIRAVQKQLGHGSV